MQQQTWSYIGRDKAGVAVCAAVDQPEWAKDTAKEVAKWLRQGLTIERVPVEWVRKHLFTAEPYTPASPHLVVANPA